MSISVAQEGSAIRVISNPLTNACNLHPEIARGWITHVRNGEVSFFLYTTHYGGGEIKAKCKLENFSENFAINSFGTTDKKRVTKTHYSKNFPSDFQRT